MWFVYKDGWEVGGLREMRQMLLALLSSGQTL